MGRDLLTSPYGRFFYIPKILAEEGHEVYLLLLSYKRDPHVTMQAHRINWESVSLFKTGSAGYISRANSLVRAISPDWIIGFSDTYYGILAKKLGDRYSTNSAIDAYDNYEGYIPWLKPLHYFWRRSLSGATLVTAAGPSLAELFQQWRHGKPTVVVPMAADPKMFVSMDRHACKESLGLPVDKKFIGYCGRISASRDIDVLFDAFRQLAKKRSDVGLVLSGRMDKQVTPPAEAEWLGYLPNAEVPKLLNSLDVLVVSNRPSKFGNYSHPVKLYEAMSCGVPVVASDTPATRWILKDHPELLTPPQDSRVLREKIEVALALDRLDYGPQPDWRANCEVFHHALETYA